MSPPLVLPQNFVRALYDLPQSPHPSNHKLPGCRAVRCALYDQSRSALTNRRDSYTIVQRVTFISHGARSEGLPSSPPLKYQGYRREFTSSAVPMSTEDGRSMRLGQQYGYQYPITSVIILHPPHGIRQLVVHCINKRSNHPRPEMIEIDR